MRAPAGWIGPVLLAVMASGCGDSPAAPSPPPTPAPPTLLCPAPIVRSNVLASERTVEFPLPTVLGGAAPVQVSCTPPPGSEFPVGSSTVQCTAVDRLNRQATCAFLVTLESEPLNAMRFLAFGDSITAGADGTAGDLRLAVFDPAASYPTALRRALQADFPNQEIDVLNRGVGGEPASCDASPTFCGEGRLRGELFEFTPDVLLLLHGYNDMLAEGVDAVDQVVDAMDRMVRNASEFGLRAVFVGALTPGRTATGPRDRQIDPAAIRLTNEQLAALSSREGAYFVDLHAAFSGREAELVADDGLHPTELGNAVIAETFYAQILEVLQGSGLTPTRGPGRLWRVR